MWFKKSSLWTKKIKLEKSTLIPNIVWVLSLCLILFLWFFLLKNTQIFNFNIDGINNLNPKSKVEKNQKIEKIENEKNKINILIIWRWWWAHDAPNLTDTIILASINSKGKIISMLSIPRDIYIKFHGQKYWKINWLYAKERYKTGSSKEWIEALKTQITAMTWQEIDYYINIDFEWFKKIIDTIWGVEINIFENFVDNEYPDWNWWYETLMFKKWTWIFDGENALKYARSRHSTSDFDRSIRQQQVITAIKDKLSWSYFLTSPLKIKKLYDVFAKYVDTDLKLSTLIQLVYNINWSWKFNILSSNLNNSCYYWSGLCTKWWFLYTPDRNLFWWASILLVEWTTINNLSEYEIINKFSNVLFNHPWVYIENYKINIFNWVKMSRAAWVLSNDIIRYWFNIPKINSIWNTPELYEKSTIYYNNIDENSATIKALKEFFVWDIIKTDIPKYSKDNAKIEIIIWADYKWKEKPFKF